MSRGRGTKKEISCAQIRLRQQQSLQVIYLQGRGTYVPLQGGRSYAPAVAQAPVVAQPMPGHNSRCYISDVGQSGRAGGPAKGILENGPFREHLSLIEGHGVPCEGLGSSRKQILFIVLYLGTHPYCLQSICIIFVRATCVTTLSLRIRPGCNLRSPAVHPTLSVLPCSLAPAPSYPHLRETLQPHPPPIPEPTTITS